MDCVYKESKNCSGCEACFNICPVNAISMQENEDGFIFPNIDHKLCIDCGRCKAVCDFQNKENTGEYPIKTFAATHKDKDILFKSSSGGAFSALASIILDKKGVVFGCIIDENLEPHTTYIESSSDLHKMRGSKYVQSYIGDSYKRVKSFLHDGRLVLFSGTPCQVAGLKSFLGKNYNNLYTVDVVCHGVPSYKLLSQYINYMSKKMGKKIKSISFRNKDVKNKTSLVLKLNNTTITNLNSYYYNFFLNGWIYRDSCYACKYASPYRYGDFTIGDYWGIKSIHPEINDKNGVSLLTINNKQAELLLPNLSEIMDLKISDFEKARQYNKQLNAPTDVCVERKKLLRISRQKSASSLAHYHKKRILINTLGKVFPKTLKVKIKNIIIKKERV